MKSPIRDGPAIFKKSKQTMKKIMFNDKYGLTQAVLEGRKTMTRRMVGKLEAESLSKFDKEPQIVFDEKHGDFMAFRDDDDIEPTILVPTYNVGEVVAVAQSYESMANGGYLDRMTMLADNAVGFELKLEYCGGGYKNKMFVASDLMPHHIRITDIKVERLQDISEEDCIKEGVMIDRATGWYYIPNLYVHRKTKYTVGPTLFEHPNRAYLALCKKLGMVINETANPYVIAYTFKLFKKHRNESR